MAGADLAAPPIWSFAPQMATHFCPAASTRSLTLPLLVCHADPGWPTMSACSCAPLVAWAAALGWRLLLSS